MKKIGIIGAMEIEIDTLRTAMTVESTRDISGMTFYEGTLDGAHVVLVRSGKAFKKRPKASRRATLYPISSLLSFVGIHSESSCNTAGS